ncbi:YchJ family protein [Burkholderia multivorans]|uniref:YchJ family protein n=1 Tax=Burkholderia multivorans TaxID=87883 RepID=UPI0034D2DDBF
MICPCSGMPPGASFEDCCRPALDGQVWPTTAEALMRSRFTAFSLQNADHLFRTWHPRTRPTDLGVDDLVTWTRLEVLGTTAGGEDDGTGTVHFRAHYRDSLGEHVLEENSSFARRAGRWLYVGPADG